MKHIIPLCYFIFTINSTLSAATYANYINISGGDLPPNINYTTTDHLSTYAQSSTLHSYNGPNLVESGNYSGATLDNAYIRNAWLNYTNFSGANLSGSNLVAGHFYDSNFSNTNLSHSLLNAGNFSFVDFTDADLSGAVLTGTYLGGANFTNADLTNAIFDDAGSISLGFPVYLNTTKFEGSTTNLGGTWTGAILTGALLPRGYDQAWFEAQGAVFEAVPEPSSYALLIGSLALGLVAFRRR